MARIDKQRRAQALREILRTMTRENGKVCCSQEWSWEVTTHHEVSVAKRRGFPFTDIVRFSDLLFVVGRSHSFAAPTVNCLDHDWVAQRVCDADGVLGVRDD